MSKTLIAGFACLVPLIITAYLILFTFKLAALPFFSLAQILISDEFLNRYPWIQDHTGVQKITAQLMAIIFLIITSYFLGVLAKFTLKKYIIDKPLSLLRKLPILGWLISLSSDLSNKILNSNRSEIFIKTVLVPFFSDTRYALGFVTAEKAPPFAPKTSEIEQVTLIPTSPHPLSGFLILSKKEALILTHLDPEKALVYLMSCGTDKDSLT